MMNLFICPSWINKNCFERNLNHSAGTSPLHWPRNVTMLCKVICDNSGVGEAGSRLYVGLLIAEPEVTLLSLHQQWATKAGAWEGWGRVKQELGGGGRWPCKCARPGEGLEPGSGT